MKKSNIVWGRSRPQPKPNVLLVVKRHKKRASFALLCVCVIVLLFGFFFGPWLQVSRVEIVSEDELLSRGYIKLLAYGGAITQIGPLHTANVFLVQERKIENALKKNFPEIKDVTVKTLLSGALVVTTEKRKERALYCVNKGTCYFIDEEGVAWSDAPEASGLLRLVIAGDREVKALGERPLSQPLISAIFTVEERIKREDKFAIKRVMLRLPDFVVITNAGFEVLLDPAEPVGAQLDALFLVLEKEIPEEKWGEVEYIDVRIPNRVYYKLKN